MSSPPAILTLPVEIRQRILRYAFLAVCSPAPAYALDRSPLVIQLLFASDVPDWLDVYGFWGREPMSRLLRINHQLAAEAIDVLYGGDFTIEFSNSWRISAVAFWLELVGEKRRLVRHVGLSTVIDLKAHSGWDAKSSTHAKKTMICQMEAWAHLRRELPALRAVRIYLGFVNSVEGGQLERDRLMYQVMGMVKLFEGLDKVSIDGDRSFPERETIVQGCSNWATGET